MPDLEVRPARPEDRAAVLAFSERTWEDGDYVAAVWDAWLADPDGALLVGLLDGRPVALAHVGLLAPGEAWLEGVRVAPEARGRGFGRVMVSRALAAADQRGATVVRLFADADNVAAHALFRRFGFAQVAAFYRYAAPPAAAPADDLVPRGSTLRPATADDLGRLGAFLDASNLAPLNGGLLVADWSARRLTPALLRERVAAGAVRLLEEWGAIQALAIARAPAPDDGAAPASLEVEYLDGAAEGIGRMAFALRREAAADGLAGVRLAIPDLLILHDAMDGAGYVRLDVQALWCFARDL